MKKLILLLIGLFLFSNLVYALDCQYSENKELNLEGINLYETKLLEGIDLSQAIEISTGKLIINIKNNLDVPIKLHIVYHMSSSWFGSHDTDTIVDVGAYDQFTYKDSSEYSCRSYPCGLENIKIYYLEPMEITLETCNLCGSNACLNDGSSCSLSTECGGGYCVRGVCSNSEFCFDNNCKCTSDEIQCDDNKQCVEKGVVPIDVKPECNKPQECNTEYIDSETGLCEKSPAQIQEEENQKLKEELVQKEKERRFMIYAILGLTFIFISGVSVIWYLKNKHEKEKQNTLQKEIELEAKKTESKESELNELKKQISQINKHKKLEKEEIEKLINLKTKREDLIQYIENQYKEITRPFPDSQANNRMVVINPYLGGYKCFFKEGMDLKDYPKSSILHRWVWKKHNERYPRRNHHIHHIDEDKYNNDPRNLEEIEGKEHYEKHRSK
jgi:hypothetical protein